MTIKSELAACRAAFAAYEAEYGEPAKYAHGLHHELAFEEITEPIENRIAYILSDKPKKEQAVRFSQLRPVTAAAWAEYDKVRAPALAEYDKVMAAAHSIACPIPDTCTWKDGSYLR